MSEELLKGIDTRLSGLADGQTKIESRLGKVEAGQVKIGSRLDRVEIGVEGLRDDVKQVAEGHASVLAEIARTRQAVIDHIDSRIDPLEEAVRALYGNR